MGMTNSDAVEESTARLLTLEELSDYTQTSPNTLYQLLCRGAGPRSMKIGRNLRFRYEDVEAWLDSLADMRAREGASDD
jgi:excisionase family DNA binding protein